MKGLSFPKLCPLFSSQAIQLLPLARPHSHSESTVNFRTHFLNFSLHVCIYVIMYICIHVCRKKCSPWLSVEIRGQLRWGELVLALYCVGPRN